MRIAFATPFKPLDHANPSGDLMIARELFAFLQEEGHDLLVPSRLRCRWIYWKPLLLCRAWRERRRLYGQLARQPVDLWLTYHAYYKAPDVLGPSVCRRLHLPYVIFQGSYATKFRRRWQTLPGFLLNRRALLQADLTITTRSRDLTNLRRLLPPERIEFIRPGLSLALFRHDAEARCQLRAEWGAGERPVILSAAMFRPDVKSEGIAWVIESCARLRHQGHEFLLVLAGDGRERDRLRRLAATLLADRVVFTGRIGREAMHRLYSAADLFAFPGFRESLGMVYLEAQACGLPVIACDNGGVPEVVVHGRTGLLCRPEDAAVFDANLAALLSDPCRRRAMGDQAADHVRRHHDLATNYRRLNGLLEQVRHRRSATGGES